LILRDLRGPEGPLFHGDAHIREFFRSLQGRSLKQANIAALKRCATQIKARG
jgi:hypothetical protein